MNQKEFLAYKYIDQPEEEIRRIMLNLIGGETLRGFKQYTVEDYLDYLRTTSITREINQIHLHHTWKPTKEGYNASSNKERVIFGMWSYHTKQLGWSNIGQHISLAPDGTVWDGRDINKTPASIKGHNTGAFAIEMIGNFDVGHEKIEGKQLESLIKLLRGLFDLFKGAKLVFHREYSSKTCPGTSVNKEAILNLVNGKKVAIMDKIKATKEQLKQYLLSVNPNPQINCTIDELIDFYIEEGEVEGVRGDIAFAQSCHETGYFKFGGIVQPSQNNFGGIGALNNNAKGEAATFSTPRIGVRAQIQHLKGYATTIRPTTDIVDPRYQILVDKKLLGTAPNFEDLGGSWAWPGYDRNKYKSLDEAKANKDSYGHGILKIFDKILSIKTVEPGYSQIIVEKDAEIERLKAEIVLLKEKISKAKEILS